MTLCGDGEGRLQEEQSLEWEGLHIGWMVEKFLVAGCCVKDISAAPKEFLSFTLNDNGFRQQRTYLLNVSGPF